jgi:hypothetical protein
VVSQKYPKSETGQSVRERIPDLDGAKTDHKCLLAVIIDIQEDELHWIGTKFWKLRYFSQETSSHCAKKLEEM